MSINANIDVHHVVPSNYIKKKFGEFSEEFDYSDSILNKIRINKISNIKIKDKAPSIYLNDIKSNSPNPDILDSLESHSLDDGVSSIPLKTFLFFAH